MAAPTIARRTIGAPTIVAATAVASILLAPWLAAAEAPREQTTALGASAHTAAPAEASAPSPRVLVVALGPLAGDDGGVLDRGRAAVGSDAILLSAEAARAQWLGVASPAEADLAALAMAVEQARTLEADFETVAANELRAKVLAAYERALRPDDRLRALAATAAQDAAAALHAEGKLQEAERRAAEAARRFPDHAPNALRYPPDVMRLFEAAIDAVHAGPRGRLTITSTAPGAVWVEGRSLGESRGTVVRTLPVGTYRVWVVTPEGPSLPRRVHLGPEGAEVHIDPALDACVEVTPVLQLTCKSRWLEHLGALAAAVGAERAVGVPTDGQPAPATPPWRDGVLVWGADAPTLAAEVALDAPRPQFSPLYLIPFGGAQFAQDRPVFGGIYAGLNAAAIAWFIGATVDHAATINQNDIEAEVAKRDLRNAATGVMVGVVLGTVAEALVVGLLTGE